MSHDQPRPSRLWIATLLSLLVFAAWWRGHTIAPALQSAVGWAPYPVARGDVEPLDCDEALYAYIGHRLGSGDRLYADVSENKPPLGYLIYRAGVSLGGYNEVAVRLLPVPFVLATIACLWWIGFRLAGPAVGTVAGLLYALASCDPYTYGNGAQFEQFMNAFGAATVAMLMEYHVTRRRAWAVAAGAALACGVLVKQVAAVQWAVGALIILGTARRPTDDRAPSPFIDLAAFTGGAVAIAAITAAWLLSQGTIALAFDDIVRFGGALATDTLPEPNAPSRWIRWFTGNSAPDGALPPPFGSSDYVAWWGAGTWPFWVASALATFTLLAGKWTLPRVSMLAWLVLSWLQVLMPGLYWAHYYLLPMPAASLIIAVGLDQLGTEAAESSRKGRLIRGSMQVLLSLLLVGFFVIQLRGYLYSDTKTITQVCKKGQQWLALRELGREFGRRSIAWDDRRLFVWGWQSPLNFYSGVDSPTRHAFTNNLMRDHASTGHPLIEPRVRELMDDLRRHPPELVWAGYPPFDELRQFLRERYLPSRLVGSTADGRGLWVRKDEWVDFETYEVSTFVGRRRARDEPVILAPRPLQ